MILLDLYFEQLQYTNSATKLKVLQTQYASKLVVFWDALIKAEQKRLETIKKSLQKYLTRYQEIQSSPGMCQIPLKLLDSLKDNEALKFFEIESLLSGEEILNLKKQTKLQDVDFKSLSTYIQEFKLKELEYNPLVIKNIPVQLDVGTVLKSFKEYQAIFTVDRSLLFVRQNEKSGEIEIHAQMQIPYVSTKKRTEKIELVDVQENQPSMFVLKKNVLLKFDQDTWDAFEHTLINSKNC